MINHFDIETVSVFSLHVSYAFRTNVLVQYSDDEPHFKFSPTITIASSSIVGVINRLAFSPVGVLSVLTILWLSDSIRPIQSILYIVTNSLSWWRNVLNLKQYFALLSNWNFRIRITHDINLMIRRASKWYICLWFDGLSHFKFSYKIVNSTKN